jgi:uncharacterized protein
VLRYVVFYESADNVMSKAPPVYPRHVARLKEFRDRGDLLLVGTFGPASRGFDGGVRVSRSRRGIRTR